MRSRLGRLTGLAADARDDGRRPVAGPDIGTQVHVKPSSAEPEPEQDPKPERTRRPSRSSEPAPVPSTPRAVEVISIARRLGRMKLLLVVFLGLSALAGLFSAYEITLRPPGLEKRELGYGTASLTILLDAEVSPLRDAEADLAPLVLRAQLYAAFLQSERVRRRLARRLNISVSELALVGQAAQNPRAQANAGAAEQRGSTLAYEGARYRLTINAQPSIPLIAVNVLGPSGPAAARLARVVRTEFVDAIRRDARRIDRPGVNRLTATAVGTPVAGQVSQGASIPVAAAVAMLTFVALTLLALLLGNIIQSLYTEPRVRRGD